MTTRVAWSLALAACLSCSAPESGGLAPGYDGSAGSGGSTTGDAPPDVNPLGRPRCQAPAGVSASPRTTEEAVQLLNALPKPTSVACFVESLARPLAVQATSSPFSAQPALSRFSPRVFIKIDQLWISVVVDGDSSYLIEFGYRPVGAELTSIKGELQLPLFDVVPPSAPYDRVRLNGGTGCGLCHYNERRDDSITFASAFASIAFRPRPDSQVSVASLQAEHASCDWYKTAHRCEMLSAILDGGLVTETAFPDTMATFF